MRKPIYLLVALLLTLSWLLTACDKPTPAPAPKPVTPVTKLDVGVGTPPPEGWRWVVAELNTGADEIKEASEAHGFFWMFFVIKGSTEVSTADGMKVVSAGEGIMVPARQQHSHRHLPQSKILMFDVRSANDNPDRFHGGTKLLLSDKLDVKPSSDFKLRVREFTLSPGQRTAESLTGEPNFVYVEEGTLSVRTGDSVSKTEAGKSFSLPLNVKHVESNDGTMPLRFLLVDVRP